MIVAKPRTTRRAEEVTRFDRGLTLCASERCVRAGAWWVDGEALCTTHAGREALIALSRLEKGTE